MHCQGFIRVKEKLPFLSRGIADVKPRRKDLAQQDNRIAGREIGCQKHTIRPLPGSSTQVVVPGYGGQDLGGCQDHEMAWSFRLSGWPRSSKDSRRRRPREIRNTISAHMQYGSFRPVTKRYSVKQGGCWVRRLARDLQFRFFLKFERTSSLYTKRMHCFGHMCYRCHSASN